MSFVADEQTKYDYDANDRLTREQKDIQGTTVGDTTTFYQYENALTPATNDATQQTAQNVYNGLLSAPTGSRVSFMTFSYNVRGRLSQVIVDTNGDMSGGQTTHTYLYNDDGIRVQQTVGPTTTKYHIDPQNHTGYAQILEEKNPSGSVTRTYTIGHDVLAQATSATAVQHLVYDGHGSTRALLNSSGALFSNQRYAFDAYGNQLIGTGLIDADAASTRLLYSGEWTAIGSKLQYLRARWQRDGRFLTTDPFAGVANDPLSLHKYLYVSADPVNGTDPSGLFEGLVGLLGNISSSLRVNAAQIAVAFNVYDKVDTVREASQLISAIVRGAPFDPVSALLFLANFLPFGKIGNTLAAAFRHAPTGLIDDTVEGGTDALAELSRVYKSAGAGTKEAAEFVGVQATALVAVTKGLQPTSFKAGYHGIDGLFKDAAGNWIVVEAKGGAGTVQGIQMSQRWLRDSISKLVSASRNADVPQAEIDDLLQALSQNKIRGMVVSAPLNAAGDGVKHISFELKTWGQIGASTSD